VVLLLVNADDFVLVAGLEVAAASLGVDTNCVGVADEVGNDWLYFSRYVEGAMPS